MFGETEFDLRFTFIGIPVRVHPAFWIVGAIMGYSPGWAEALGLNVLAVVFMWWVIMFVSILVHELGHAFMAEFFGWPSHVLLYHFGGLAFYNPTRGHAAQKSIAISFAGPGAGFVLFGVTCAVEYFAIRNGWFAGNLIAAYVIIQLKFVNLWWGLMNLLPVLPLDGGRVSEQVLRILRVRNSDNLCAKISIVVAGCVAAFCLTQTQDRYVGFLFLFLAVHNYQTLQR